MWKKEEKKNQLVMGNFPNLSFHCLVVPAAVCRFWGNLQLGETGLHISSFGAWMMAFSMVLWSQFYTWVMAALNYSHNIMGKMINPSLPLLSPKQLGNAEEATYPKGIKWWWGTCLGQKRQLAAGFPEMLSSANTSYKSLSRRYRRQDKVKEDKWGKFFNLLILL